MRTKLQKDAVSKFMDWVMNKIEIEKRSKNSPPDLDNLREIELGFKVLVGDSDELNLIKYKESL